MSKSFAAGLILAFLFSSTAVGAETGEAYRQARLTMVKEQIADRGISDRRVLKAMESVPRHAFVPAAYRDQAYADHPLPIGYGQTISQPYIVAYMCEVAGIRPSDRILEVGTGSGYHASVISRLASKIYTIEIIPELARRAEETIRQLGYENIVLRQGDGYFGWKDEAPFDVIIVTAAADHIPPPLLRQLKDGGRMIIPLGHPFFTQKLVLVEKKNGEIRSRDLIPVRFVPLTGSH
jgi:protein-L-isoaspartate(D-aspartate) O-methyltransferase